MASTVRLPASFDLGELRKDLESVELGLGRLVTSALGRLGETAADETQRIWPVGPGPNPNAKEGSDSQLPHMRETIAGQGYQSYAAIVSDHPGAQVVNWGGAIAPRGVEISFPAMQYAQRAVESVLPRLEAELDDEINALAAQYLDD